MKLKDLYDLVWSKPLKQICTEHEIAYADFKKLCTENKIPLPELGYWTKLSFDKPVSKTALPVEVDVNKEIDLIPLKIIQKNRSIKPKISNPKKVHPLVVKTKQQLTITKSYRDSVVRTGYKRQKDILPIHTDKKLQKRALKFMNIFISNAEARGIKIKFVLGKCYAELYNQTILINLRQKYHREERITEGGWSTYDFVKSDKLEFQTGYINKKNWLDTEKLKIEERIPNILDNIEKKCVQGHQIDLRNKILKNKRALEEQKQQEIERLQKIEEEKTVQLFNDAKNWQRAELLRKFMDAKKENEISKGTFNKETEKWLAWVTTKINDLDPLQN
ncbi:hypothetical protein Q2T41_16910 [Maribacter confluentis]|uniref:Uncharacterized protein n=1 Tax=Maribacter confluentis TaxID=1656093 RepID=A0ABT8RVE8_9FLAO|nr:hypothetical protein [Maribacter confluentis]MDO1514337.1 hypothetical protein [Maribacter confluentis]